MQLPDSATPGVREYAAFNDKVPGWLPEEDFLLLDFLLRDQTEHGVQGDIVEIGVFHGRTSILLGFHLRHDERLVACDLFEDIAGQLHADQAWWYAGLTQEKFLGNYRMFHATAPRVLRGPSDQLAAGLEPASVRMVHIDGDHDYEGVKADLDLSREYLKPGALVVCDDYATVHSPGVAAAVWEAVVRGDLVPFAVTGRKLYARWGVADEPHLARVQEFVMSETDIHLTRKALIGHDVLVIGTGPARGAHVASPQAPRSSRLHSATRRGRAVASGARRGWRLSAQP